MQYVSIHKVQKGCIYKWQNTKEKHSLGYLESQESDNLGGGGNRLGRTPGGRWLCALSWPGWSAHECLYSLNWMYVLWTYVIISQFKNWRDKPNQCPLVGALDENQVRGLPKKGVVGSGVGRLPLGPVRGEDLLPMALVSLLREALPDHPIWKSLPLLSFVLILHFIYF